MSTVAKSYIGVILASGAAVLLLAARSWPAASFTQFAAFCGFVILASTLKIRIPGMSGTMSPNFAFLLLGMAVFTFSEEMVACLVAALVQSLWRPKRSPRLIQVLFNAAVLVLSGAFAFTVSRLIIHALASTSAVAIILFAGTLYLPANTMLISIVVSLVEKHPVKELCQHCYQSVFPYFVFGIVLAGLIGGTLTGTSPWQSSLLLTPAMVLAYLYFLGHTSHRRHHHSEAIPREEEELIAASYHR